MQDTENQLTEETQYNRRKFTVGQFNGPLDLLWQLIRENKMNIYDIPIADITEQYLDYLDYAVEINLQDLSDFYFWAAKLLHIKSETLMPVEVNYDDDESMEDPRDELVEQLIEYQRFKKLSILMEEQEEQSEWSFERRQIERALPATSGSDMWEKIDANTLLLDMQKIFKELVSLPSVAKLMGSEDITSDEKKVLIRSLLDVKGECMFTDLITRKGNELDVVCAFMAILEVVGKDRIADIYQNRIFGNIKICRKKVA